MVSYNSQLSIITAKAQTLGIPEDRICQVYEQSVALVALQFGVVLGPPEFQSYYIESQMWTILFPNVEPFLGINPIEDLLKEEEAELEEKLWMISKLKALSELHREANALYVSLIGNRKYMHKIEHLRSELELASRSLQEAVLMGVDRWGQLNQLKTQEKELANTVSDFFKVLQELDAKLFKKIVEYEKCRAELGLDSDQA